MGYLVSRHFYIGGRGEGNLCHSTFYVVGMGGGGGGGKRHLCAMALFKVLVVVGGWCTL